MLIENIPKIFIFSQMYLEADAIATNKHASLDDVDSALKTRKKALDYLDAVVKEVNENG